MLYGLGRKEAHDNRDTDFLISENLPKEIRKAAARTKKYHNEGRTRINQGSVPACVGAAFVHYLINGPVKQDPKRIPNFIDVYRQAQEVDEWPGNAYAGTSVRAGAKIIQKMGFIESYLWAWDLQTALDAILNVGPIVVGTVWTRGMSYPDAKGFVRPTGVIDGGHAYLANGVNMTEEKVRCQQSWDPRWGDTGNFWLRFEDFGKLISWDGEICLPVEIRPAA